ncbi:MAG: DUF4271 domain-containing protein [Muribaculaceae bacterium]
MITAANNNIATSSIDTASTAAADSLQPKYYSPKYVHGFGNDNCYDSVTAPIEQSSLLLIPQGQQSQNYIPSPLHDTGTMALFLMSMFMVTICFRYGFKYFANFSKNLFSLKKRDNLFDDHSTVNEMFTLMALIANTCIMESILIHCSLWAHFSQLVSQHNIFFYVATLLGISLLFYLLQLFAYLILGYTFTNKINTGLLIKGLNASQALLGLFLIPLVIFMLVYPLYQNVFIVMFCILYAACRLLFIIKGYRIFFVNYTSIFYFILYLCSGEIIPLLAIYSGIMYLYSIF